MTDGPLGKTGKILGKVPLWVLLVAVFVLGFLLRGGGGESNTGGQMQQQAQATSQPAKQDTIWTCAMHPQIRMKEPGKCPICGMTLIPVTDSGSSGGLGPRQIRLSKTARELAEVETSTVERRRAARTVRMPGKVAYDETTVEHITAWVGGRIDKLYVDYTGMKVSRGQKVAELYSPELYSAQEELLQALQGEKQFRNSSLPVIRSTAASTLTASRRKLELFGLSRDQIQAVIDRGEPSTHMTIASPLSGTVVDKQAMVGMYVKTGTTLFKISNLNTVWVELEAYEQDLPWLKDGQQVSFTSPAFPGEKFSGRIDFIDPVLNPKTRTAKVRVVAPNRDGRLKPEMLATAVVESRLNTGGESPLMIPATAPLITGKRAVVYIKMPSDDGVFEGREIVLGPRAGDYYIVREGLKEGDQVVTKGAFKIDAAIQIAAKPSMMNPEGGEAGAAGMQGMASMGAGKPSAAKPSAPEHVTGLPEQFTSGLAKLYQAYFAIHDALAADNYEQAVSSADKFGNILSVEIKMSVLNQKQHMTWMKYHSRMKTAAENLSSAGDISGAREAFSQLSDAMAEAVKQFGGYGVSSLVLFHCPMAFENRGAIWLQSDGNTRNPYYGAMMPGCQDRIDTLYTAKGKGK